jgi:hypothetical protein
LEVDERPLTEEVLRWLNLDSFFVLGPSDRHCVECATDLHDDCFAAVEPVDGHRLERLLHATLKLHSFYLRREVEWERVLPGLRMLLETVGEITLTSDGDRVWLRRKRSRGLLGLWHSVRTKDLLAVIRVRGSEAILETANKSC